MRILLLALAGMLCALPGEATIFGNVRAIVHDPNHRPIPGARVELHSATSDWIRQASSDSNGEVTFPAVPVGEYRITIHSQGFQTDEESLAVDSGSAPILHFQMKIAIARQTVEVSESAGAVDAESATISTTVSRRRIERTPGADRTNSLAAVTDYVPGAYMIHDQLHIRGGHQVTWAVDGVPVPNTNIASNVGPQFDPKDADYMEVQRGGYSAEYGDRTFGVINIVPRTGFERNNEGELVLGYGSFHQTNDQLSFGSHTERFAYYGSVNGNRTDLGLEPPSPFVIHNRANGFGSFGTLLFNPDQNNQLRFVGSARRDFYQIPNDPETQAAGIRDVERESDSFANLSWVHTSGSGILLTVSPFYHFNRADYEGGRNDIPVSPMQNRASHYAGAQISISAVTGKHNARAGVYGFGEQDNTLFGLQANDGSGLSLRQREAVFGHLEALFLEDQYKLFPYFTLTGGVRLTHFSGSLAENAASPRIGAALRIPHLNWVLRGFYGRYYQAPPLSTVAGPLLQLALDQGFGFLPLRGERDESHEFGLTIPLHGWVMDVDHFNLRARNFFDHNPLGNSNIFFPVTIDGARIRGWEMTLRSPRLFRRGQMYVAFSRQFAQGQGAVSGGLTDFSPPEGLFFLDHDQRYTVNTGFQVDLPQHTWASGNVYYGSGFVNGEGPDHLPGHTSMDLSLGKSVGETWSVSLNALNVANRRLLLDNSETFGGIHYAYPRQIFIELRYRFHY